MSRMCGEPTGNRVLLWPQRLQASRATLTESAPARFTIRRVADARQQPRSRDTSHGVIGSVRNARAWVPCGSDRHVRGSQRTQAVGCPATTIDASTAVRGPVPALWRPALPKTQTRPRAGSVRVELRSEGAPMRTG